MFLSNRLWTQAGGPRTLETRHGIISTSINNCPEDASGRGSYFRDVLLPQNGHGLFLVLIEFKGFALALTNMSANPEVAHAEHIEIIRICSIQR